MIPLPRLVVRLQEKTWLRDGRRYRTFHVTLPKPLVDRLGLEKGDRLEVRLEDGRIVYIPRPRRPPARGRQTTLF